MNNWNISGEILKHGVKGKMYPKLWIQALLSTPQAGMPDNKLFINFDMDANPNSRGGKIAEFIKSRLDSDRFFFLSEAMIAMIQTSKKDDKGEWMNEDVIGVKGKLTNLTLSKERFDDINLGLVRGNVEKYVYLPDEDIEKMMIKDNYLSPKENKWKFRPVPIMNDNPSVDHIDLTSKIIFVQASLCGVTPKGESKVYGWAKRVIVV